MLTYKSKLSINETQHAILEIKKTVETFLKEELKLLRVSAPIILNVNEHINDYLEDNKSGVIFDVKGYNSKIEIVQSLAKWKRKAIHKYEIPLKNGIFASMNAIRPNEKIDFSHSLYVDQWDWEYHIDKSMYNMDFLELIGEKFFQIIRTTERYINSHYPNLEDKLPNKMFVISSDQLYKMYPDLNPKERELEIVKIHKFAMITKIGKPILDTNIPHSKRANDYDNLELNADIIVYHKPNNCALELMSFGIRVDKESLLKQADLKIEKIDSYSEYYKNILNGTYPLTIGGGLGQSRLCMYLLEKKHIGEVQVSCWPDSEVEKAEKENIKFL